MKRLKQTLLLGTSIATAILASATISPTQAHNRLSGTSNEPIASIEATPLVAANNWATLESEIIAEINRVRTHPSEYAEPETSIDFEKLAQEIFIETNRARTNPEAYAEELEARIPYYQGENGKMRPDENNAIAKVVGESRTT